MRSWTVRFLVVAAFAVAFGHVVWRTYLGPRVQTDHRIGGSVPVLTGVNPDARHLYLRHTLHLTQQPRHAWIEVLASDRARLIVNGRFIESKTLDGHDVGMVKSITELLRPGRNVIALHVTQTTLDRPPRAAVRGGYVLSDGEHTIDVNDEWYCNERCERRDSWWFTDSFEEKYWPRAGTRVASLRPRVAVPPEALKSLNAEHWVTPLALENESASLRRAFHVPRSVEHAWLRVTTTASSRLAVNGVPLDSVEENLALPTSPGLTERIYDITPVIQNGSNVVQLLLSTPSALPHARADIVMLEADGQVSSTRYDSAWLYRAGAHGWLECDTAAETWAPCQVETGILGLPVEGIPTQVVSVSLPWYLQATRWLGEIAWLVLLALPVYGLSRWIALQLEVRGGNGNLAYLALAVPATLLVSGLLALHDPRLVAGDVYNETVVLAVLALVAGQWLALLLLTQFSTIAAPLGSVYQKLVARPALLTQALLAVLLISGFALRIRDLHGQGLQWDEVENYNVTRNFLERGFPMLLVHDDLPPLYIHTSELEFVTHALVALVTDDPQTIVRLPSVVFATLTIPLLFWTGRRLFNAPTGLIAAVWFTYSPICVANSTFGRYFCQLQFFALLTVYFYWLTLRGAGPINKRALWLATASFLAMFFTWEASALLAPPMVLACLIQRRRHMGSVLRQSAVWQALCVAAIFIFLQRGHATFAQIKFLWYGVSLSDIKLMPMWNHPLFRPWYYILESTWNQDTLLPMLTLGGAILLSGFHAYRRPLRFVLIIYLGTCLLMSFTLPNIQFRYAYHLIPLQILLGAFTLWASVRGMCQWAARTAVQSWWPAYASAVGMIVTAVVLLLGSGVLIETRNLTDWRVEGLSTSLYKFPNLEGPSHFLRDHLRQGDIVIANDPFQINHLMGQRNRHARASDFTISNLPFVPGTLDDRQGILLDRRDGARILYTQEMVNAFFDQHPRVWYVTAPGHHFLLNSRPISTHLRMRMRVAYEDWDSLVLFAGDEHRPMNLMLQDEKKLENAREIFLP